jgi:hypothetical protein
MILAPPVQNNTSRASYARGHDLDLDVWWVVQESPSADTGRNAARVVTRFLPLQKLYIWVEMMMHWYCVQIKHSNSHHSKSCLLATVQVSSSGPCKGKNAHFPHCYISCTYAQQIKALICRSNIFICMQQSLS